METILKALTEVLGLLVIPCRIPADKQMHAWSGAIAGAILFPFVGILYGLYYVTIVALSKEVYDYCHQDTNTPDFWDAVATVSGGCIYAILFSLVR